MSSYDFEWIQWKAESGGNGHWYAVVGEQGDPIFWTDAREAAANLGAETHLATITSAAENTFIFDSLVRDRPEIMHILLGGEQRPEAGEPDQGWTWVTGEEFAYTNWAWGEPNDYDGLEDWLLGYRDGSWNDMWTHAPYYFYVAESSIDPRKPDLLGTPGRDILNGTVGNDNMDGLDGDDILNGGAGADVSYGGLGNDVLNGDAGADRLNGRDGTDVLNGGSGDDVLMGGAADDVLNGDAGNDDLSGDDGADVLNGGEEDDRLDGGIGHDTLLGGDGKDLIDGGAGPDVLYGGSGTDIFVWDDGPAEGVDRIMDFEDGTDRLDLTTFAFKSLDDLAALIEPRGPDTLIRLSTLDGGDILIADINVFELSPDDILI